MTFINSIATNCLHTDLIQDKQTTNRVQSIITGGTDCTFQLDCKDDINASMVIKTVRKIGLFEFQLIDIQILCDSIWLCSFYQLLN